MEKQKRFLDVDNLVLELVFFNIALASALSFALALCGDMFFATGLLSRSKKRGYTLTEKNMSKGRKLRAICVSIGERAVAIRMSLEQAEKQMSEQIDDWNVF